MLGLETSDLILLGCIIAVTMSVFMLARLYKKNFKGKKGKNKKTKILLLIYKKLYAFPFSGNKIRKITEQLRMTCTYSTRDMYATAAAYYLTSVGAMLLIMIVTLALYRDIVSLLICFAFSAVVSNKLVYKKIDSVYYDVYKELRVTISSLRQEYLRLNSVTEALQECEVGERLKISIEDIIGILSNSNGEIKLQEFIQRTPFRTIQTLARICYNVANIGDEVDSHGQSSFIQALTLMSTDINIELERIQYKKHKFGNMENLALAPLFLIKVLELGITKMMPGTFIVYSSLLGYGIRVGILLSAIIVYQVVSEINTMQTMQENDRSEIANNLLKNKSIHYFVAGYAPKNAKRRKVQAKLDKALSKKTILEFYLEKLLMAIVFAMIALVLVVSTPQISYNALINSTASIGLIADTATNGKGPTKEELLDMDNAFIAECDARGKVMDLEEATEFVANHVSGLTGMEQGDQATRIIKKYNTLKGIGWKFYYLGGVIVLAGIGWIIPDRRLKLRTGLVKTEAEEDFMQLQTLMTIIMTSDCDTLEALEQMTEISKIHKDMLTYCYHGYPSNPELELARLSSKTNIVEFKRFIDKLKLTINDLSLKEAFSDMLIEREYINSIKKMTAIKTIDENKNLCDMLIKIPNYGLVIGTVLTPIIILGISEIQKLAAQMTSL